MSFGRLESVAHCHALNFALIDATLARLVVFLVKMLADVSAKNTMTISAEAHETPLCFLRLKKLFNLSENLNLRRSCCIYFVEEWNGWCLSMGGGRIHLKVMSDLFS